jgi:hypothetical protein
MLLSQLRTVAPRELLVMYQDQDFSCSSSVGAAASQAISLSSFRQYFPSCQIHLALDLEAPAPSQLSANPADASPSSLHSADSPPVHLPLQLGLSLLRSLIPSNSPHSSSHASLIDVTCAALFAYLSHNLRLPVNSATFRMPQPLQRSRFMHIDAHAARALELTRAQDAPGHAATHGGSDSSGCVLRHLDMTLTAGGSRCMQAWLLRPLVDVESIVMRQDAVECFVQRPALRRQVRDVLQGVGDVQRCMQKMLLNRASPSDATSLARSLHHLRSLQSLLTAARQAPSCASNESCYELLNQTNCSFFCTQATCRDYSKVVLLF